MEGNTTTKPLCTMMHSVALDQSTVFPNDDNDDDYVVVEYSKAAEPSHTGPLLEGISDDEDEDEYDYCDDIENESSSGPMDRSDIEQSISFEEVSERLYSTSKFYFGEEADQLLLELDTSASFLHEVSENEEVSSPSAGSPSSSSSLSHNDNAASDASIENEEKNAFAAKSISSQSDDRNHNQNAVNSDLEETKKPALTLDAPEESTDSNEKPRKNGQEDKPEPAPQQQQQQQQQRSGSSVSRLTNKKRRKQMKLAKKAAAAAAAAASLGHISTMGSHHSHHSIGSNSASHPSYREKTNATAMKASPRGKNKKQVAPSSIAVACATQSLAEYRLELQSHHRNNTATTKTTVTNKLVR